MLWQHDQGQPIGVWDEVVEDTHGLRVSGRLLTDVAKGREAAALMSAGAVDGLSIGYRTLRAEKQTGGGRKLYELELWEVSLVTFPMLPVARVSAKEDTRGESLMTVFAKGLDEARTALKR
jgi:HK97 family phage prohead protease